MKYFIIALVSLLIPISASAATVTIVSPLQGGSYSSVSTIPLSATFSSAFTPCSTYHWYRYMLYIDGVAQSGTWYIHWSSRATDTQTPLPSSIGPLPAGNHTVSIGFNDRCSGFHGQTRSITVSSGVVGFTVFNPNTAPVASIVIPTGDTTVTQGQNISFSGIGADPNTGDTITAYEWREGACSTGTLLSSVSSFNLPNPNIGVRTVYLRVQDAGGLWSTNCQSRVITVTAPSCTNGASNYPTCTTNSSGQCINGTENPTTCDTCASGFTFFNNSCVACTNGAVNYPTCTTNASGQCINGATDPALCAVCGPGKTLVSGVCAPGGPICGNSTCEVGETATSCLVDCKPKTKFWLF